LTAGAPDASEPSELTRMRVALARAWARRAAAQLHLV